MKGRKNINVTCKDLVSLAQKIFNKVNQKEPPTQVFLCKFCKI